MKEINIRKKDLFYFIFFLILSVAKGFGLDGSDKAYLTATIIGSIFLIGHILSSSYNLKQIIVIVLFLSLGILITIKSKQITVFMSILAILFSKNIDFNKLLKATLIVKVITFTITVVLSFIGVLGNGDTFRKLADGTIEKRYSLGYVHPNITYLNFFVIVILYLYIKYDKINKKDYFYLIIMSTVLYLITDSRTGYISVIIGILVTILFRHGKIFKSKMIRKIIVAMPFICGMISIIFSIMYSRSSKILVLIDNILTGRLQLGNRFIKMYGLTLFGQKITQGSDIDGAYLRIDNGYISLIMSYGIVIFLIYIFFMVRITKRYLKEENYPRIMLLLVFSVYGLTETYIYNVFVNVALLFISDLLYKSKKKGIKLKYEKD